MGWVRGNLFLLLAVGLMIPVGIGLDRSVPWLNGPPEWRWLYRNLYDFWENWIKGLLGAAAGLAVIGGVCWALRRRARGAAARRGIALAGLVVFGVFYHVLGAVVAMPARFNHWGCIVVDSETTSYYTVAQAIRDGGLPPLGETLRRYPELQRAMPQHASTHPPGAVLVCVGIQNFFEKHQSIFEGVARVYERLGLDHQSYRYATTRLDAVAATTVGLLLMLAGVLAAWPLTALIRAALGEGRAAEAVAWSAAALWVTYPALILFEPEFDQIYPAIVLGCLYAALRGLRGRPVFWGVIVGLLFMLAISFSFVMLFLAPMLALLAALELARGAGTWRPGAVLARAHPARPEGRRLWMLAVTAVVVCFVVDAALRLGWGIRLLEIFQAATRVQRELHLPRVNRQYHVWLFYNLYDFLFFAGTALAVLALAWLVRVERGLHRGMDLLVPAWVVFPVTALTINISGLTPAETARIWLFLAPGVAWAGAAELVHRGGERWKVSLGVLLIAQIAFYFLCRSKMEFIGW